MFGAWRAGATTGCRRRMPPPPAGCWGVGQEAPNTDAEQRMHVCLLGGRGRSGPSCCIINPSFRSGVIFAPILYAGGAARASRTSVVESPSRITFAGVSNLAPQQLRSVDDACCPPKQHVLADDLCAHSHHARCDRAVALIGGEVFSLSCF